MLSNWLIIAGVAAATVWTAAPLSRSTAWWVRAFDFPRAQFACLTAAMALAVALGNGLAAPLHVGAFVALLVLFLLQLRRIIPYTALYPCQMLSASSVDAQHTIGVLVANVYMPNRNGNGLLKLIDVHDADLVLTLESDEWWGTQLDTLAGRYPFCVKHPRDNTYGMHLYSRLPLIDSRIRFLVEDEVPSIHTTVQLRSGHRVKLHCVHPAPPSPTENPSSDERDAELLIVARDVSPGEESVIVTGDLNDVAWSATTRLFQRLSGLLDPRIGRGTFGTFHARAPLLRWPLDHLFASPDFSLVSMKVLEPFGSDHLPVHVVLGHDHAVTERQQGPETERGDRARMRRKIERVDAGDASLRQGFRSASSIQR